MIDEITHTNAHLCSDEALKTLKTKTYIKNTILALHNFRNEVCMSIIFLRLKKPTECFTNIYYTSLVNTLMIVQDAYPVWNTSYIQQQKLALYGLNPLYFIVPLAHHRPPFIPLHEKCQPVRWQLEDI